MCSLLRAPATQIDGGEKFLYIDGDAAGRAYTEVGRRGGMRGFGYWDIADDDPKCVASIQAMLSMLDSMQFLPCDRFSHAFALICADTHS